MRKHSGHTIKQAVSLLFLLEKILGSLCNYSLQMLTVFFHLGPKQIHFIPAGINYLFILQIKNDTANCVMLETLTRFIIISTGLTLCGFILSSIFFTCSNVGLVVTLWDQHFFINYMHDNIQRLVEF